jgi:hypothetical protein
LDESSNNPNFGVARLLDSQRRKTNIAAMVAKIFERTLQEFTRRAPFQPFVVELVSGGRFTIDHPEALVFRSGVAVYLAPDGSPTLFDHQGVSRLEGSPGAESGNL